MPTLATVPSSGKVGKPIRASSVPKEAGAIHSGTVEATSHVSDASWRAFFILDDGQAGYGARSTRDAIQ